MIRILRPAQQELDEAFVYYEHQLRGLGAEFIDDFEKAGLRIELFPFAWPAFTKNIRRCLLSRFPYAILYSLHDSVIEIIAGAHLHRAPVFWKSRVPKK